MQSISWQSPSFHYQEKSAAWYMWSMIVTVVVAALSLIQGNILFVFFVIIAEAMVLIVGKQKPRLLLYEATETRISVDRYREYPYVEMAGFALVEHGFTPRYLELVLIPGKRLGTAIKMLVPVERAEEVKNLVSQYLQEIAYDEPVSGSILKRIGL